MTCSNPLRVHLILNSENSGWIIQKMAEKIASFAGDNFAKITMSDIPDPDVDVNHWMSYAFANGNHTTKTTMMITHLDDPYKIRLVKSELKNGVDTGICISSHHRQYLVNAGIPSSSLIYAVPGNDFTTAPRRQVIGITTRVYKDGRKREAMLVKLAQSMALDRFIFSIFGEGWENVIPILENAGACVQYHPGTNDYIADYEAMIGAIPYFDYYLYLGRDEGSLGTLDALAAGVKTIITPQGFHCDLPCGITYPVWSQKDLECVFAHIIDEATTLTNAVARFTWRHYADRHYRLWHALKIGGQAEIIEMTQSMPDQNVTSTISRTENEWRLFARYMHPLRLLSALGHLPILKPIRRWWFSRL
jgi:hypothetical protein